MDSSDHVTLSRKPTLTNQNASRDLNHVTYNHLTGLLLVNVMATGAGLSGPYYSAMTNHNTFPLFVNGLVQSRDFAGIVHYNQSQFTTPGPRDLSLCRSLSVPLIWYRG